MTICCCLRKGPSVEWACSNAYSKLLQIGCAETTAAATAALMQLCIRNVLRNSPMQTSNQAVVFFSCCLLLVSMSPQLPCQMEMPAAPAVVHASSMQM
jgi:hypothetical protein